MQITNTNTNTIVPGRRQPLAARNTSATNNNNNTTNNTNTATQTRAPPPATRSTNTTSVANSNFVGSTSVGAPPKMLLPEVESIRYRIHDFANRREKRGEYVETKAVISHGYPWKLRVFPRGRSVSLFVRYAGEDDEYINNYYCNPLPKNNNTNNNNNNSGRGANNNQENNNTNTNRRNSNTASTIPNRHNVVYKMETGGGVTARANFICKHHKKCGEIRKYTLTNDWGFEEFLDRERILNGDEHFLDENGALTIDVELQVAVTGPWVNLRQHQANKKNNRNSGGGRHRHVWYPKETIAMLQNSGTNGCSTLRNVASAQKVHTLDGNSLDETTTSPQDHQYQYEEEEDTTDTSGTNHLASLLFSSQEFADVTFHVQGITFKAHKAVLAVKCRTLLELVLDSYAAHDSSDSDSSDDSDNDDDDNDDDDDDDDDEEAEDDSGDENEDKKVKATTKTTTKSSKSKSKSNNKYQQQEYIELNDVKPKVFETLLEYVYGVRKNNNNDHTNTVGQGQEGTHQRGGGSNNQNNNNTTHHHHDSHDEDDDRNLALALAASLETAASGSGSGSDSGGSKKHQKSFSTINDTNCQNEHVNEMYAQELLLAGNRFGCAHLKLYAESILVDKHLTLTNAPEYLPLADAHACALLKEASMDLIAENPQKAMKTPNWYMVEESSRLLTELLLYYNEKQQSNNNTDNEDDNEDKEGGGDDADNKTDRTQTYLDTLDVTSLRCCLEESNLPCDGSRQMLINRLKNHEENMQRRALTGKDTPSTVSLSRPAHAATNSGNTDTHINPRASTIRTTTTTGTNTGNTGTGTGTGTNTPPAAAATAATATRRNTTATTTTTATNTTNTNSNPNPRNRNRNRNRN